MTTSSSLKAAPGGDHPRWIVSTDLDGTLLDHHSYDWRPAQPALEKLKMLGVPIIINTSKTFEEVLQLQSEMNLEEPFIVENGSAVYLPVERFHSQPPSTTLTGTHWQFTAGCERDDIVRVLRELRDQHQWSFRGFADMTVADVQTLTGLPEDGAEQAKNRRFSEPLVWEDSDNHYINFVKTVTDAGFKVIRGGRFVHILGQTDKGQAISWFRRYYEQLTQTSTELIALGDSPNDIDMLQIADYAVAVKSPTHDYPEFSTNGTPVYTEGLGPVGWNQAIHQITEPL